jgi:hypothetical protein
MVLMTTAQAIVQRLMSLPEEAQREVLDFVEFIEARKGALAGQEEAAAWSDFSLSSAMRGMEDEETLCTLDDMKESFR